MKKHCVETDAAPGAIGPYSQAVVCDGHIYTSGQIPLDPATGELVDGGITEQTHQVMRNLSAVLEAAGTGLDGILKTTIFLADLADFQIVNAIYGEYLQPPHPARSTIQVAALPKGALIEIEAIANATKP